MTPTPPRVIERALSNVTVEGDCIVSLYSRTKSGYAQIGWHEDGHVTMRYVHRVAWEARHGPIPDDMTVDHLCHNRGCLKLEHLRLLSNLDNARRNAAGRDFPVGWHCKGNHPASAWRLLKRPSGKYSPACFMCKAEHQREYVAKNIERIRENQRRWWQKKQAEKRAAS